MTVSLDGFVNDRTGSVDLLYPDFEAMHDSEALRQSIHDTGAVVMGRNSFDMADDPDWFAGNYEYQVPIFVLTHHPPSHQPKETADLKFSFVTDGIEGAIAQARAAAGEKDVTVLGVSTIQQCLRAGLGDELHLDVMPVLLGGGLRLFEELAEPLRLEQIDVLQSGPRTSLRYRFVR
jgi:dihydrofolate reductase